MKQRNLTVAALATARVGGLAFSGSTTAATISESESNGTFVSCVALTNATD